MKKINALMFAILSLTLSFTTTAAHAEEDGDIVSINKCIKAWGKASPFKEGTSDFTVLGSSVKVFGIGGEVADQVPTEKPQLVLIKPNVTVLGKTTLRLYNPNGWYCFKPTVSVLGKTQIEAHCQAHLASTSGGTNVLGGKDRQQGVTVLGSLRVNLIGDCK